MKPKKRKLTLGEVQFMQKIGNIGQCNCIHCGFSLASTDALAHYVETQTCLYCHEETSDSLTDISI